MPDFTGDEGLEGLDDALGDVILRKTYAQKKTIDDQGKAIGVLQEEVERLKRLLEERVTLEDYQRDMATMRVEAKEAMTLARECRSELNMQGPALRDELLKLLRDELAAGITAQQALATSHAKTLAELQGTCSSNEGRLAASEIAIRNLDQANRERGTSLEAMVGNASGKSESQLSDMEKRLQESNTKLLQARTDAEKAAAEQERLAYALQEAKRREAENHDDHQKEIAALKHKLNQLQG